MIFFNTQPDFAIQSQRDAAFRDSVCRSHMSVADGMPLVWLARFMGLPVGERVAEATVFDALRQANGTPWRVSFMGGPPGVAQKTHLTLNTQGSGMRAVGWIDPGLMKGCSTQGLNGCGESKKSRICVVATAKTLGLCWVWRFFRWPLWCCMTCGNAWQGGSDSPALPSHLQQRLRVVPSHSARGATQAHCSPMRQAFEQAWASGLDAEVDASASAQVDAQRVAQCGLLGTALRDAGRRYSLVGVSVLHRQLLSWHAAGHSTP